MPASKRLLGLAATALVVLALLLTFTTIFLVFAAPTPSAVAGGKQSDASRGKAFHAGGRATLIDKQIEAIRLALERRNAEEGDDAGAAGGEDGATTVEEGRMTLSMPITLAYMVLVLGILVFASVALVWFCRILLDTLSNAFRAIINSLQFQFAFNFGDRGRRTRRENPAVPNAIDLDDVVHSPV